MQRDSEPHTIVGGQSFWRKRIDKRRTAPRPFSRPNLEALEARDLPAIVISNPVITEGSTATFTITRTEPNPYGPYDGAGTGPISTLVNTFDIASLPSTATAALPGEDYQAIQNLSLSWGNREYSSRTVSVPTVGDNKYEPSEKFGLKLTITNIVDPWTGQHYIAAGTAEITNNDPVPTVTINDVTKLEGNSPNTTPFAFTVSLSNPTSQAASVYFKTVDGTATTASSDYSTASGKLDWQSGDGNAKTITVAVRGDNVFELAENFSVLLYTPANCILGAKSTGVGTILDDNDPIYNPPSMSIANPAAISEGNAGLKALNFQVTLSAPSPKPITVVASAGSGTALLGQDFTAAPATLIFTTGEKVKNYTTYVSGDWAIEPNEQFTVNLSNPQNVTLLNAQATGTISNDDAPPTVSVVGNTVPEGNSGLTPAPFKLQLSHPAAVAVSVQVSTSDGTARAGSDYQSVSTVVTIAAGDTTKTFNINVIGDTRYESAEQFHLTLSSPINATLGQSTADMGINSDDAIPNVQLFGGKTAEGNRNDRPTVGWSLYLPESADLPVTIYYATTNASAIGGEDYLAIQSYVVFQPGETHKELQVTILGDTLLEADEAVYLKTGTSTALIGPVCPAIIGNDDLPLQHDRPAIARPNSSGGLDWFLDTAGDGSFAEKVVKFGLWGDIPVMGDWNGDGNSDIGVVRYNPARGGLDWYFNTSGVNDQVDAIRYFGLNGDTPVVGDWDRNGRFDMGVVRYNPARGGLDWYLNYSGGNDQVDAVRHYGLQGDTPVVGDWDGDGRSDLGIVRANDARGGLDWYLNTHGVDDVTDEVRQFGLIGDTAVVGDWNGDGKSDMGAVRSNPTRGGLDWYFDFNNGADVWEELTLWYGLTGMGDIVRAGQF